MVNKSIAAIILAAGKGTRMKSALPKVMHAVACKPMVVHVLQTASVAGCSPMCVVVAPDMDVVKKCVAAEMDDVLTATQTEQHGTAHAVLAAKEALKNHKGNVLVLYGDTPLIRPETLQKLQAALEAAPDIAVAVLGMEPADPAEYGRLVLGAKGDLEAIVEYRDADEKTRAIRLCNSGVMAIRGEHVWALLAQVDNKNAKQEFYLTDIIKHARAKGLRCAVVHGDVQEMLGVNSRAELAEAETLLQQRLRNKAMAEGVTMIAPETVFLAADTSFGRDVVVQPHVFFGPEVAVGNNVEIRGFSHIEGAVIADGAAIGPYARIRPGSNIGEDARIGNFVELKKANVERGAKISHLSYIGDALVGENANVGAGTITCNYDGYSKHHTEIGKESFIGSNTALVAPVVVGEGAIVAAGSVITEDVPADALAITRGRQQSKENWAQEFRDKQTKKH